MKLCLRCNQYFQDALGACPEDNTALEPVGENPLIGALLSDRYVVESVIGKGSSGIVYKARRMERGEMVVAVKVLHSYLGADSGSLDRFLREARAASRLRNPHIITIWDTGVTDDGQPFFVMDYLEGGTLADVIAEKGYLPPSRALPIVKQICDALTEAHKQGIVHRDLKPENVVLQETDQGDDYVKLLDFGIADSPQDQIKQKLEKVKTVSGSPAYMSPEQCQGFELDPRSDIYSLGIVVFEMLTGQRPFKAAEHMSLMFLHVSKPPFKLAEIRSDIKYPPALETMLAKALAKKPGQRQQTIKEFWTELENSIRDTEYGSALVKRPSTVSVQADAFSVPEFDRLTSDDSGSYGSQQSGWGFVDQSDVTPRSVISSTSKEVSPPPAIAPAASSQDHHNFTPGDTKYARPIKESNGSSVKKKRDTTGTGSGSFAMRSTGLRGVKSYGSSSFQGLSGLGFESSLAPNTAESSSSISNAASTKPSLADWSSGSLAPASNTPAIPTNGGDSKSGALQKPSVPGNGHKASDSVDAYSKPASTNGGSNGGNGANNSSADHGSKNGAETPSQPVSSSPSSFLAHATEAVAQSSGPQNSSIDTPIKPSATSPSAQPNRFKVPPPAGQITESKASESTAPAPSKPIDSSSVVPASIIESAVGKPVMKSEISPADVQTPERKPMTKTKQDAMAAQKPGAADAEANAKTPVAEPNAPAPLLRAPTSFMKPNTPPASNSPVNATASGASDQQASSAAQRSSSSPFKRFAKTEVDKPAMEGGQENNTEAAPISTQDASQDQSSVASMPESIKSEQIAASQVKTDAHADAPTEISSAPVLESTDSAQEKSLDSQDVKDSTAEKPSAQSDSASRMSVQEFGAQGFLDAAMKNAAPPASAPPAADEAKVEASAAQEKSEVKSEVKADASKEQSEVKEEKTTSQEKSSAPAASDVMASFNAPPQASAITNSFAKAAASSTPTSPAKPNTPAQNAATRTLPSGNTNQLRPNSQPGAKPAAPATKVEAGADTLKLNANDVAQVRKAHAQATPGTPAASATPANPPAPATPASNLPSAAATNSSNNNAADFVDLPFRHPTGFVPAYSKPPSKEWEIRKPGERRKSQESQNSMPVEKGAPADAVKPESAAPEKGIFSQHAQSQSGNYAAPSQEALSGLFMDFTQQAKQAKNAPNVSSSNLARSNSGGQQAAPPPVPPKSEPAAESGPATSEEKKEQLPTPSMFDLDIIATKSLSDFHREVIKSGDSIPSLKKKSDVATQSINLDPDFLNSGTPLLSNEERLGQLKSGSDASDAASDAHKAEAKVSSEALEKSENEKAAKAAHEAADKLVAEEHEKSEQAAEEARKQIEQEKIVSEKIKSAQIKADQLRAEQQKADQEQKAEAQLKAKLEAEEAEKARALEAAEVERQAEEAKANEEKAALEAKQAAELQRQFKEAQAKEQQMLAKERKDAADKARKQEEEKARQAKARQDEEAARALEEIAERERKAAEATRLAEEEESKLAAEPYVDPAAPKVETEMPPADPSDSLNKLAKSQTTDLKPANSAVSRLIEAAKKAQSTKTSMEVYSDERLTAPQAPATDSGIPNQFFTDFDSSFNKPAGKPSSAATTRSVDNFPTGQHNRLGPGQASQEPLSPNDYGLNVKDSQFLPKYTDARTAANPAGRQPSSIAPSPGQLDTGNIPQPTYGGDNAKSVADLVEAKRLANEQRLALTAKPVQEEEPEDMQSFVKQKYEAALSRIRGDGHKTQQKQKAQKAMNATRNRTAALRSRPSGFGFLQFFLAALVIFLLGMAGLVGYTTYQDMNGKGAAKNSSYQAAMDKKDYIQVVKILEKKEEQINLSEKELKDLNAAYYGAAKQARDSKHYADGIAFLNKLSERAPKNPDADKLMKKLKRLQGKR